MVYLNVVMTIIIEKLFFLRGPGLNVTLLSCAADIRVWRVENVSVCPCARHKISMLDKK